MSMDLSPISRTAILTLIAHAAASGKEGAGLPDPMAGRILAGLIPLASTDVRRWILSRERFYRGFGLHDALAGARRARIFDDAARRFLADHPGATIVNLGAGFDTRYWRIANENCRYIELDLPEVVAVKKKVLGRDLPYELIGCSVLDPAWIEAVTSAGNRGCLLLAEGLFMWLPQERVQTLLGELSARFRQSLLVVEVVEERFTRGIWKALFRWHSRLDFGLDVAWVSGIRDARQLESWADGLRVTGSVKGTVGPILSVAIHEDPDDRRPSPGRA